MSLDGELAWLAENWARAIVALTSTITSGVAIKIYSVWRKGKSDDLKVETDSDASIRQHWAGEVQSIRDQLARSGEAHAKRAIEAEERHRAAMQAADERFDRAMQAADAREAACQEQVKLLREDVRLLSEEIMGLRRISGQASRSAIVLAAQTPTLDILDAADRAATALTAHDEQLNALPHAEIEKDAE